MSDSIQPIQEDFRRQALSCGKNLLCTVLFALSFQLPSLAQQTNGGQATKSVRNPLIQGALSTQASQQVANGKQLAPGDGPTPAPVVSGQSGPSTLLPWVPAVPSNQIDIPSKDFPSSSITLPYNPTSSTALGAFRTIDIKVPPPPSTPGKDPGELPGPPWSQTTSGKKPPALQVNVNKGGGLSGNAPIHKWGGQPTQDLGLTRTKKEEQTGNINTLGSQTTDFGQYLKQVAVTPKPPVQTNDKYRGFGANGAPTQPNFPTAQQTDAAPSQSALIGDLFSNGFRQFMNQPSKTKGGQATRVQPVQTIAPY